MLILLCYVDLIICFVIDSNVDPIVCYVIQQMYNFQGDLTHILADMQALASCRALSQASQGSQAASITHPPPSQQGAQILVTTGTDNRPTTELSQASIDLLEKLVKHADRMKFSDSAGRMPSPVTSEAIAADDLNLNFNMVRHCQ